jgi:uncharacterized coiled-coil protein SlyX
LSQAQDQVIETLKKQLAEMHESMKKMAARIDQLEREKTTANLRVDQVEKSTKALQSAPSALNPAIGMAIDATAEHRAKSGGDFNFRAAEIGISASIGRRRGRGGGDGHHFAAVESASPRRALFRRLRPAGEVSSA